MISPLPSFNERVQAGGSPRVLFKWYLSQKKVSKQSGHRIEGAKMKIAIMVADGVRGFRPFPQSD